MSDCTVLNINLNYSKTALSSRNHKCQLISGSLVKALYGNFVCLVAVLMVAIHCVCHTAFVLTRLQLPRAGFAATSQASQGSLAE